MCSFRSTHRPRRRPAVSRFAVPPCLSSCVCRCLDCRVACAMSPGCCECWDVRKHFRARDEPRRPLKDPPCSAFGGQGGGGAPDGAHLIPPPPCGFGGPRLEGGRVALRRSTCGDFWLPAPCFRAGAGPTGAPRSGRLPPPFLPAASSHSRQPVVVPADGSAGASRKRGHNSRPRAPPPPHARQCPAERPSRGVVRCRNIC
jgi:hypothetical protein